jgi:hypothetical protein
MQEIQWTDDSLSTVLNFQWIDMGRQVLVWASDNTAFCALAAAVPGDTMPAVSNLWGPDSELRSTCVAAKLGNYPPMQ